MKRASGVLGLVLVAGCIDLVAPEERPPLLIVTVMVDDSVERRIQVSAWLRTAWDAEGVPAAVLDPALRVGGLEIPITRVADAGADYRLIAEADEADRLLPSLLAGPVSAPEVAGYDPPPSLAPPTLPVRAGPADIVWSGAGDLVLPLDRLGAGEGDAAAGAPLEGNWSLDVHESDGGRRSVLKIRGEGDVPAGLRVPAALAGACRPGDLGVRLSFWLWKERAFESAEGYAIRAGTNGTIWWRVTRECT